MKILISLYNRFDAWRIPDGQVRNIRSQFPDTSVVSLGEGESKIDNITDADVFFGWTLSAEELERARSLKWFHSAAAGVGGALASGLADTDIIVTNSSSIHAETVADHALSLIACFSRLIHLSIRGQVEHAYNRDVIWDRFREIKDLGRSTIGIIGLGRIGTALAQKAKLLGMTVLALRSRVAEKPEFVDQLWDMDGLGELLSRSDFVVLALPLTERTHHIIGESELAKMKADTVLVNVGRGRLIDEKALCRALKAGRIGGAALDVFEREPLHPDNPLYEFDNVIITPHVAGLTPHFWNKATSLFVENLCRFLDDRDMINVVDKKRGY